MTRRHFEPGQPVHAIQRGNNRATVFHEPRDARFYLDWLGEAAADEGVALHAYVLMTNHLHLLVTPATAAGLGRCMQSVGIKYTRYINATRGRTGTLWDGPYRAAPITDEAYFMTCSGYIEMNPVRAGLAANPGAYRWSSYKANADGAADPLVTPHALYLAIGPTPAIRQAAYREMFSETLADTALTTIRDATNAGTAIVSGYARRKPGRPKRNI